MSEEKQKVTAVELSALRNDIDGTLNAKWYEKSTTSTLGAIRMIPIDIRKALKEMQHAINNELSAVGEIEKELIAKNSALQKKLNEATDDAKADITQALNECKKDRIDLLNTLVEVPEKVKSNIIAASRIAEQYEIINENSVLAMFWKHAVDYDK